MEQFWVTTRSFSPSPLVSTATMYPSRILLGSSPSTSFMYLITGSRALFSFSYCFPSNLSSLATAGSCSVASLGVSVGGSGFLPPFPCLNALPSLAFQPFPPSCGGTGAGSGSGVGGGGVASAGGVVGPASEPNGGFSSRAARSRAACSSIARSMGVKSGSLPGGVGGVSTMPSLSHLWFVASSPRCHNRESRCG